MDKFTKIWILLVLFTLFSFSIGWFKLVTFTALAILIFTTFVKGQLITDYFMGLKEVQGKYRFIPTIWLVVTLSLVALAYYTPVT